MFRFIRANGLQPFGAFDLTLPPVQDGSQGLGEVHLITGVNGTGKTRLLSLLAALLGNPAPLRKRLEKGTPVSFSYSTVFLNRDNDKDYKTNHSSGTITSETYALQKHGTAYQWASNVPAFAYSGIAYVSDTQVAAMGGIAKPDRGQCLSFNKPPEAS